MGVSVRCSGLSVHSQMDTRTGCPVTKCFHFMVASGHILIFLARVIIKESLCFKIAVQIKLCAIWNATSAWWGLNGSLGPVFSSHSINGSYSLIWLTVCITAKSLTDQFIFRILKKQILQGVFVSDHRLVWVKTYLSEGISFHWIPRAMVLC